MRPDIPHVWAVVPVKAFAEAKKRLATVLGEKQRDALARTMLHDVVGTLAQCRGLAGTIIVTRDAEAARIVAFFYAHVLREGAPGLNAAITTAATHLEINLGGAALLVVPGDVPHVSRGTVETAVEALRNPGGAVLARAERDGGTNLFGCNPASALPPSFGPGSYARHCADAEAAGLRVHLPCDAELGLDLDEPADLHAFLALNSQTCTHALLRSWDIAANLTENVLATASFPPPCGESRHAKHVGVGVVEIVAAPPPTPTPPHKGEGSRPQRVGVRA